MFKINRIISLLVLMVAQGLLFLACGGEGGGASISNPPVDAAPTITHGSQINETNTGVPPGHTLMYVGTTIIVTEAWINSQNGGSRILENRRRRDHCSAWA